MTSTLLTALLLSSNLVYENFPAKNCHLSEAQRNEIQEPLRIFLSELNLGEENVSVEFALDLENTSEASEVCNDIAILLAAESLRSLIEQNSGASSRPKNNEDMQQEESDRNDVSPTIESNSPQRLVDQVENTDEEEFISEDAEAASRNGIKSLIDANDVEEASLIFTKTARNEEFTQQLFIELFDQQWQKKTIGRVYDFASSIKSMTAFESLLQHQQNIGLFQEHPLLVVLFSHRLLQFTRSPDFEYEPSDTQQRAYALARGVNADRHRVIGDMVRDLIESESPSATTLSVYALIALPSQIASANKAPEMVTEAIEAALPYLQAGKIGVPKLAEMFATLNQNSCPALALIFNSLGPNTTSCQNLEIYMATHTRLPEVREKVDSNYFNKICVPVLTYVNNNYLKMRNSQQEGDLQSNINCLQSALKDSFIFYLKHKSPYTPPIQQGVPNELSYALQQTNLNDGLKRLYNDTGVTKCHLLAAYADVLREAKLSHKAAILVTLAQAEKHRQIIGVDTPERKVCANSIAEAPFWARRIVWSDPSQGCNISNFVTGGSLTLFDADGKSQPIATWKVTFDDLGRAYLKSELHELQMYIESTEMELEMPLYRLFLLTDIGGDQVQIRYIDDASEKPGTDKYLWKIDC
ncbi:Hypothetical predicted protein [Cloeon dipterum]|uniref:Vitellogenin domain-containing protein n=1 Tax=Cloeon dipterum TaxID=197152 RepID=A0A8S1CT09_9INSE|nr:Hypothetical predicted protein [Cloeon dipterum]